MNMIKLTTLTTGTSAMHREGCGYVFNKGQFNWAPSIEQSDRLKAFEGWDD